MEGRDHLQDLGAVGSNPWHWFREAYKCHTYAYLKPRYSALPSIASVLSFNEEINASVLDWLRSDSRTLLAFVKYLLCTAFHVSCGLSFLHTLHYFSFCTLFYIWVSMHHKSIIYNKPTRSNSGSIVFVNNYKYALHVSDTLCVHDQEHYKLQQQPLVFVMSWDGINPV